MTIDKVIDGTMNMNMKIKAKAIRLNRIETKTKTETETKQALVSLQPCPISIRLYETTTASVAAHYYYLSHISSHTGCTSEREMAYTQEHCREAGKSG